MSEVRLCKTCSETLVGGRADKKFCSVECRNKHFNHRHRDRTMAMRNINNILRRNRLILEEFMTTGNMKPHRDMLLEAGFRFDYFTNIKESIIGDTYLFCYEHGYQKSQNNRYLLITKSEFEQQNSFEYQSDKISQNASAKIRRLQTA